MERCPIEENEPKGRSDEETAEIARAIREIREMRRGLSLDALPLRDLINEGRR
jgi:hypothetical protein